MPSQLPRLFLVRHGDTAWTESRQHTGRTDIPLNPRGEERARAVGRRLRQFSFRHVFSSPLQRAWKTCQLAGCDGQAVVDSDLLTNRLPPGLLLGVPLVGLPYALSVQARREYQEQERST